MRRRLSGSTSEEDDDLARPVESAAALPVHGDKLVDSLADSVRPLRREPQPKGRRKEHAAMPRAAAAKSPAWTSSPTPSPKTEKEHLAMALLAKDITPDSMVEGHNRRRLRMRNPWSCSLLTLAISAVAFVLLFIMGQSFMFRQLDPKGCEMSYMRPSFYRFSEFDTEHTRFASKYSLYLYREGGIDEDIRVTLGTSMTVVKLMQFRSKVSQCSSFPATQEATNRCDRSVQKLPTTTTMFSATTKGPLAPENGH